MIRRIQRLTFCLLATIALAAPGSAFPAPAPSAPAPAKAAPAAKAPAATKPAPTVPREPVPRLEAFYEISTTSDSELRRVRVDNAAIRHIRIGDTVAYLKRRLGKPRSLTEKDKGTPNYHQVFVYDDFDVRVEADGRVSRIRVRASGAWMMRNGLRGLMQDFSEARMRELLGSNFIRRLKRVYVWPISRNRFAQDEDRARLVRMVQQYYKLPTAAAAEKKIIHAWDTVYIYPARGLRMRVYSNIPISGLFKADFVLLKPAPAPPPAAAPAAAMAAKPPGPADWPRDNALESQLARRGVRGVTIQREGRSLRLRGTVRNDAQLRALYEFIRQKGYGEVDYGVEVRWTPARGRK